jgi:hypothetical protein
MKKVNNDKCKFEVAQHTIRMTEGLLKFCMLEIQIITMKGALLLVSKYDNYQAAWDQR